MTRLRAFPTNWLKKWPNVAKEEGLLSIAPLVNCNLPTMATIPLKRIKNN